MAADAPEFFCGKRLIVFGAGYIGTELVRQARQRRLEVTALTRNVAQAHVLQELGAMVEVGDLADGAWHERVPASAELVVNCVSSGGGGLAGYRHSYVDGLRSILAWREQGDVNDSAVTAHGCPLVYTSSTSVYPQGGGVRVDESAPTTGAGESARILLEAEGLLRGWRGPAYVLRLAGLYGPGRHHLLDQLREGATTMPGHGDHRLNLAHREDVVSAIWAVLTASSTRSPGVDDAPLIYNVADDGAATKAEVIRWLAEKLGKPMPDFSGEPVTGRRATTADRIIANDRLKRELGWQPRYPTFREGYASFMSA